MSLAIRVPARRLLNSLQTPSYVVDSASASPLIAVLSRDIGPQRRPGSLRDSKRRQPNDRSFAPQVSNSSSPSRSHDQSTAFLIVRRPLQGEEFLRKSFSISKKSRRAICRLGPCSCYPGNETGPAPHPVDISHIKTVRAVQALGFSEERGPEIGAVQARAHVVTITFT